MEEFIKQLKSLIATSNGSYSCFAIDTKRKVGMKVGLSSHQIYEFLTDSLNYLCDKKFSKMQLGDYPIATPKDFIEKIKSTNSRIATVLNSFLCIPVNAETNVTNLSKYNAYMVVVTTAESKYYFFTKRTPFIAYKKNNFIYALFSQSDYRVLDDNVVRLIKHFDCIVMENTCYMIGMNGRNLLGLNDIARDTSLKNKKRLVQEGIISQTSENLIDSYMKRPGKAQCLSEVDESLMQIFGHITLDNKEFISTKYRLGIIQDANGKLHISTSNEEEIEDLVATLTNKRGKNFEDETVETKSPFVKR